MMEPVLKIDATNDHVVISGRLNIMDKAVDLNLVPHEVDISGEVRAEIYDPAPRGLYTANALVRAVRGG